MAVGRNQSNKKSKNPNRPVATICALVPAPTTEDSEKRKFVPIGSLWRSREPESTALVGRIESVPLAWQKGKLDAWELVITFAPEDT